MSNQGEKGPEFSCLHKLLFDHPHLTSPVEGKGWRRSPTWDLGGFFFAFLFLVLCWALAGKAGYGGEIRLQESKDWVPEWAKRVVWYQIFPERFRNGDQTNDPKVEDQEGAWPHDHTSPWEVHPWTSDWYEPEPYEKKNGKDIWFNIQRRRYGGDLAGILSKLDYLRDLGITAVYLNPVFWSPSLHKYDGILYHHIDPNFGPDPEGDKALITRERPGDPSSWTWTAADRLALKLIKEAHKRRMRIIFDGVFNHIGIRNPFFQDVARNQQSSPFRDWFTVKSWDDPKKGKTFDYEGWFGVKELPEWRENDKGIVPGPRRYIFESTRRWMDPDGDGDPSDGIDGWRLDVAFCVKHPFWKDWSKHVKTLNPEAYMTAEIIDTVKANKPYLQGDEFTAVMNYNFAFALSEYFVEDRVSPSQFDRKLRELREAYAPSVAYAMQNLLDSHDTARIGTHIVNRNLLSYRRWQEYCEKSQARRLIFDARKPTADEINLQKLLVIFQMTYVGAPMIYYGDEAGMWGANDPCCRKPMVWEDLEYKDEAFLPNGTKRQTPQSVSFNRDLFNHYKKLISIRNSHKALQVGDFETLFADDKRPIYAFSRRSKNERIIAVLNKGNKRERCNLKVKEGGAFRDLLNGGPPFAVSLDGTLAVDVNPGWGAILLRGGATRGD
ncbi:MAG: glycoside hydrolase family 13 protein [Armatimonadetes bacterium]|nr:glycoside hydrolase family 13 protein [Armatimonadota bacterium]